MKTWDRLKTQVGGMMQIHCDVNLIDSDNVLAMHQAGAWRELNLAWPGTETTTETDNTVVFAEFKRDDTK